MGWRHKQRSGQHTVARKKNLKFKMKKSAKSLVYLEYDKVLRMFKMFSGEAAGPEGDCGPPHLHNFL